MVAKDHQRAGGRRRPARLTRSEGQMSLWSAPSRCTLLACPHPQWWSGRCAGLRSDRRARCSTSPGLTSSTSGLRCAWCAPFPQGPVACVLCLWVALVLGVVAEVAGSRAIEVEAVRGGRPWHGGGLLASALRRLALGVGKAAARLVQTLGRPSAAIAAGAVAGGECRAGFALRDHGRPLGTVLVGCWSAGRAAASCTGASRVSVECCAGRARS